MKIQQKQQKYSNKTYLQLIDIQDEINKIKHNREVNQELTHTIAIILLCMNSNSTNHLYSYSKYSTTKRIPETEYNTIANRNQIIPAPHNFFLFQPNFQREIHETIIKKIKNKYIQNSFDFTDEIFNQIFNTTTPEEYPPNLFQQYHYYKTLELFLEPLYQLYIAL